MKCSKCSIDCSKLYHSVGNEVHLCNNCIDEHRKKAKDIDWKEYPEWCRNNYKVRK